MQLKGKVAIVTGGAGGLGRAMTIALLQKEVKVCVFDIHDERGAEMEKSFQAEVGQNSVSFLKCDVSSEQSFTDAFQNVVGRYGNVDIMINNAGIVHERRDIDKVILINLGGTIRGSNLAIKHMRKDQGGKGGVIINISSLAGTEPFFALPSYVATKYGITGFTRSWAINPYLKDLGLRFGMLLPTTFTSYILPDAEEQFLYAKEHIKINENNGEQDPADIATGLIQLLEDDDSNGAMLYSHAKEGTHRKTIQLIDES